MSEIIRFPDHMMIIADYKNPDLHKHLASHIIISMTGEMQWEVNGEKINCRGICIGSDTLHTGNTYGRQVMAFLFKPASNYTYSVKHKYLSDREFFVLDDLIIDELLIKCKQHKGDLREADEIILKTLGLTNVNAFQYDERIREVLEYIQALETISHFVVDDLCKIACLSKSRLSHLFAAQTGMTLHSYIAFEKLMKTSDYMAKGKNITESCLLAGFDSSSHCAATCKRVFGISLSEVYKSME